MNVWQADVAGATTCASAGGQEGGTDMGYRVFRDSQGVEWQTWDVVPQLAERRAAERRRAERGVPPEAAIAERRRIQERRVTSGRRPFLSAGLDGGWLCFEAPIEKRRLTPIPADWLRCDEACLERYCRLAKPARSSVAVDISTLGDLRN